VPSELAEATVGPSCRPRTAEWRRMSLPRTHAMWPYLPAPTYYRVCCKAMGGSMLATAPVGRPLLPLQGRPRQAIKCIGLASGGDKRMRRALIVWGGWHGHEPEKCDEISQGWPTGE